MKRLSLVMILIAVSGIAHAQVGTTNQPAPMSWPESLYWQAGDQFRQGPYPSSVRVSPSFSQPIDWMRGIPRNDTWVAESHGVTPAASIVPQPPRHRAATFAYYPNYPEASHPKAVVFVGAPTTQVTAPPVTPFHDPFFEERFWDDLEADRDISDLWGW